MKELQDKIDQILENQIIILEELWRNTSYPSIKEDMRKAIRETTKLIYGKKEIDRVASGGMMSNSILMITFEGEAEKYSENFYAQQDHRNGNTFYYCIQYPDGYMAKTFEIFLEAIYKKQDIVIRSFDPLPA